MTKMKKAKSAHHPALHIEQHYDDGTIGAVASVAAVGVGVAVGAALGVAAELPGLLIGAVVGGDIDKVAAV